MKSKISLITLGVDSIERSLLFYRDGLGLVPHAYEEGSDMVMFKMEGTWLGLYPKEKLAEDAGVDGRGNGFSGITLAHNVKSEAEVDKVMQLAIFSGATLIKKPQKVFWGGYSGYFADPDGHLWEIAYNPFTDLT